MFTLKNIISLIFSPLMSSFSCYSDHRCGGISQRVIAATRGRKVRILKGYSNSSRRGLPENFAGFPSYNWKNAIYLCKKNIFSYCGLIVETLANIHRDAQRRQLKQFTTHMLTF